MKISPHCKHILIILDKFVNRIFWGNPSETMSSRMGKLIQKHKGIIPCVLCKFLDIFQKDHCIRSIKPINDDITPK